MAKKVIEAVEEETTKEAEEEVAKPSKKGFKLSIYLEGHKQPYVKEFASQGELERATIELKKNKSVIRFE